MFDNFYGNKHLIDKNGCLTKMIENNDNRSFILYGPPGSGKTTLANLFIKEKKTIFKEINARLISSKELKDILNETYFEQKLYLIINEIHCFDKIKQNILLEYLEKNLIYIIGTTTENPIISLLAPLRSRLLIFQTNLLTNDEYISCIKNYQDKNYNNTLNDSIYNAIKIITKKDIRYSFNLLDFLNKNYQVNELTPDLLNQIFTKHINFNNHESIHHDLISALQKSIRASDVNASIYYLVALIKIDDLEGIIRRLVIICFEDIGLANPGLCDRCINASNYAKQIGLPEAKHLLTNIVIEMSLSPKSTSGYEAYVNAYNLIENLEEIIIPNHLKKSNFKKDVYDKNIAKISSNLDKRIYKEQFFFPKENSKYEQKLKLQHEYLKKFRKSTYEDNL